MLNEFTIYHWDKSQTPMPTFQFSGGGLLGPTFGMYRFETCLRGILITTSGFPVEFGDEPPTETYRGEAAYAWLLEVLAGLHSPLLGETEVLGQFREQIIFPLGPSVPNFLKGIVEDVKKIRRDCLQNLGQKTYGSLARRLLTAEYPLYFLGAGQMTREILPFMQKGNRSKVTVVARSLARAQRKLPGLIPNGGLQLWTEPILESVFDLIIAAPVSDEALNDWRRQHQGEIHQCLDLRALTGVANSQLVNNPSVKTQGGFWNLEIFFSLQKGEEERAREKVQQARLRIQQVTEERWCQRWDRPFGWEDVCA
jgi:glutamyl-tRNA reductase